MEISHLFSYLLCLIGAVICLGISIVHRKPLVQQAFMFYAGILIGIMTMGVLTDLID